MFRTYLSRSIPITAALAAILAIAGCPFLFGTTTVPDVVGMTQPEAEAALASARLTAGDVTETFSATVPAGNIVSQDPAAGASVALDSTVSLVVSQGLLTVQGRVLYDDGTPVEGAMAFGGVAPDDAAAMAQQALRRQDALNDWTSPEFKTNPEAVRDFPSLLLQSVQPQKQRITATDANGDFSFELVPASLPARVVVKVILHNDPLPAVQTSKWGTAEGNTLDIGTIAIPNPVGAEVPINEGAGQNADGSVQVEDLPPEIISLYATSYDPDENPEAFPGDFTEMGTIPLNSSVFLWMEGLDADGNPVHDLSQAVTVRSQVPRAQWVDLEDIDAGTDRIEVPIYTFNETIDMWEQESVGWLEDATRTVLPEDAQSVILDGTFEGEVYATFTTTHFSWMNVDYAYIGPWTLSRMDRSRRNSDCLYNAMQLAKAIAKSAAGHAAYGRVNKPDVNVDTELGDGMGPELKDNDLVDEYGVYKGDSGGSETQFEIDSTIWDGCGDGATEDQKKDTTLIMAITILHETAHWKDDVKKNPDDDTDTDGEEGNQLEKDVFGGVITNDGGIKRDGAAVDSATRDGWLNQANWPAAPAPGGKAIQLAAIPKQEASPLEVTIALPKTAFELGEEIPVEVTYKNVSGSPIQAMNRVVLEGWPLYFNIVKQGTGTRVRFLGPEFKLQLTDDDFDTLGPNETLVQTVNLLRDPETSSLHYQLIVSGTYDLTAVYESFRGVAEAASNTLTFSVSPGGSISGTIADATNGQPLAGGTVKAIQNGNVLTSATSDLNGNYTIPELPAGVYTLEARASGFLRSSQENVQVTAGQNTVVSFSLSLLLAQGELRLVLTWGAQPGDLDSHLWLPMEEPYHVYYSRRGSVDVCPFAALDRDTTTGFGPETITIKQRIREGTYVYAIFNYTGAPELTASEAQVRVFDSTGLIATVDVPTTGTGRFWKVLSIDGLTGVVTEINELGDTPEPYPDTDSGCAAPPVR